MDHVALIGFAGSLALLGLRVHEGRSARLWAGAAVVSALLLPESVGIKKILGFSVSLFFVVVCAHLSIRRTIASGQNLYREYFSSSPTWRCWWCRSMRSAGRWRRRIRRIRCWSTAGGW